MSSTLTDIEIRILGSLMEKGLSTPDYYPLSLNALTNACNQKSSRDPVVSYAENDVQTALETMEERGLVNQSRVGRVPKYEELLSRKHDLVPRETAVLCVLMLRGPQTIGEVRSRTGRMADFETLEGVTETLDKLAEWGLAERQARLPGHKEARYAHLLGESTEAIDDGQENAEVSNSPVEEDRFANLEIEVVRLREELANLKQQFEVFKSQFE